VRAQTESAAYTSVTSQTLLAEVVARCTLSDKTRIMAHTHLTQLISKSLLLFLFALHRNSCANSSLCVAVRQLLPLPYSGPVSVR
jgi:hypothetical protein